MNSKPGDFESDWYAELQKQFVKLDGQHTRRKRSPLIFVEAYAEFENSLKSFEPWAWDAVIEKKVAEMKRFLERVRRDYEGCQQPAKEQQKSNDQWDANHRPSMIQGGRADGNRR